MPRSRHASEAREWLAQAREDLTMAVVAGASGKRNMARGMLYMCQQSVEKAVKAFLIHHGWKLQRTHSIRLLADEAIRIHPALAEVLSRATWLTVYATIGHYPPDPHMAHTPEVSRRCANKALKNAADVLEAVSALL